MPFRPQAVPPGRMLLIVTGCLLATLSSPVGGTNINVDVILENIDMNLDDIKGVQRPNLWGRNPTKSAWLHSDMKDMAFFYVHELYKQLVQKGNLK